MFYALLKLLTSFFCANFLKIQENYINYSVELKGKCDVIIHFHNIIQTSCDLNVYKSPPTKINKNFNMNKKDAYWNRMRIFASSLQNFDPNWNVDHTKDNDVAALDAVNELYNYINTGRFNGYDTARCLRVTDYRREKHGRLLTFTLSSIQRTETVIQVDLFIFELNHSSVQPVILRLYQVGTNLSVHNLDAYTLLHVAYVLTSCVNQSFSVFGTLAQQSNDKVTFFITVTDLAENPKQFDLGEGLLIIKLNSNEQPVMAAANQEVVTENLCKLQSVALDFTVNKGAIFPSSAVIIKFCMGSCDTFAQFTGNAKILKIIAPSTAICCVPKQYSPLTLAFYDKFDNIVIKKYYDINALNCECR